MVRILNKQEVLFSQAICIFLFNNCSQDLIENGFETVKQMTEEIRGLKWLEGDDKRGWEYRDRPSFFTISMCNTRGKGIEGRERICVSSFFSSLSSLSHLTLNSFLCSNMSQNKWNKKGEKSKRHNKTLYKERKTERKWRRKFEPQDLVKNNWNSNQQISPPFQFFNSQYSL